MELVVGVWRRMSLAALLAATLLVVPRARAETLIEVFSRPGCPHCAEARPFLDQLTRERPDVRVLEHDVTRDEGALARLRALSADAGIKAPGVPTFVLSGQVIVGFDPAVTPARIGALLAMHELMDR